ncbi:hypothetical protein [Actinoplanes sp. URMC 104]|uniref:hypothetical protein n=1 Tax=Actinoplanes sp. URMC 104 TaxID=3423409 RepID=UPI003F1BBF9F
MNQATSDVAFQLFDACVHCLRFGFGAPLKYPYAMPLAGPGNNPAPALFRRIQAVSPPPDRDGERWYARMRVGQEPFVPGAVPVDLSKVDCDEGIPSLDPATPEDIVLDRWFRVPRQEDPQKNPVSFPGEDQGRYLTSIKYWSPPIPEGEDGVDVAVDYYDVFTMEWTRRPRKGDWVAVSFDAFDPLERDSADLIIPIGECNHS